MGRQCLEELLSDELTMILKILSNNYFSTRKQKKIAIVALVIILLPTTIYLSIELTSQPQFCNSCHYMRPFYASWAESAHSDVTCTDCHFEPGLSGKIRGKMAGLFQLTKYVSLAYKKSKPWAEISDESCLRSGCHLDKQFLGPIKFKNVNFDHKHHLGDLGLGKQLRCTSCHSQMVQGEHILVTEGICFLCHMKDRAIATEMNDCQTCHTSDIFLAESSNLRYNHTSVIETAQDCRSCHVNVVEGNAPVSTQMCINCHWQTDLLDKYDDPEFLHITHITERKVDCVACHTPIIHRIFKKNSLTGEDCSSCHNAQHQEQIQLFTGNTENGLPVMPNPMYEAGLACQSCHIFHATSAQGADLMLSNDEACDSCHGAGYGNLLKKWQNHLANLQKETVAYLNEATTLFKSKGIDSDQVQYALRIAAKNQELVFKAKGIHNIALSDALLQEGHNLISEALKANGAASSIRSYTLSEDLIPSDCRNCHFGIEETTVTVYGLQFKHQRHLENDVTCTKCHSNLRQHGELLITKSECLNCHHSRGEDQCVICHEEQKQLMTGNTPFFQGDPDMMWDSEVECAACHLVEDGLVRVGTDLCSDCHDEDYPAMVAEWRDEIINLFNSQPANRKMVIEWLKKEGSLGGHNPQAIIDYLGGY